MNRKELKGLIIEEARKLLKEDVNKSPIKKFAYFASNYPPNFINLVWADDLNLAKHLSGKFMDSYNRNGAMGALNGFYLNLSSSNQDKLEDWIIENYNG